MRRTGLGVGAAIVAVMLLAGAAAAEGESTVRVTGQATIAVEPDVATLRLSVVSQDESSQRAAEENATRTQAVFAGLRKLLGKEVNLHTQGFSLQPQYDHSQPQSDAGPVLRGYRVSNSVVLRLEDLDQVGAAVDAAIAAGANRIESLVFGLKDDRGARSRALADATRRAREKADTVADALGTELLRVVSVEEGGGMQLRPVYADAMRMEAGTPVEAGSVDVSASVVLVAELSELRE